MFLWPFHGDGWSGVLPRRGDALPLRGWLGETGSLTARLRARFPELAVRLLSQGPAQPLRDERALLGLRAGQRACVREVLLGAGGVPLVFAHSAWRLHGRDPAWRLLAGLGRRPLGEVLFAEPGVCRGTLAFARLDPRHPLFHRALAAAGSDARTLWARRSLFALRGRAVLVTEVFLPVLTAYPG